MEQPITEREPVPEEECELTAEQALASAQDSVARYEACIAEMCSKSRGWKRTQAELARLLGRRDVQRFMELVVTTSAECKAATEAIARIESTAESMNVLCDSLRELIRHLEMLKAKEQ